MLKENKVDAVKGIFLHGTEEGQFLNEWWGDISCYNQENRSEPK
jgi:hypothetical protein